MINVLPNVRVLSQIRESSKISYEERVVFVVRIWGRYMKLIVVLHPTVLKWIIAMKKKPKILAHTSLDDEPEKISSIKFYSDGGTLIFNPLYLNDMTFHDHHKRNGEIKIVTDEWQYKANKTYRAQTNEQTRTVNILTHLTVLINLSYVQLVKIHVHIVCSSYDAFTLFFIAHTHCKCDDDAFFVFFFWHLSIIVWPPTNQNVWLSFNCMYIMSIRFKTIVIYFYIIFFTVS